MWQVTFLFLFRALTDLVESVGSGYVGVLDTAWVGLYQDPTPTIGPASTLASIVEATYTGYLRQRAVWFPVLQGSAGPEIVYGASLFFTPTDSVTRNQITGVFLADAEYGGSLLMAAALPSTGITFAGPASGAVVKPLFQLPTTQIYGAPDVES